MLLLHQVPDKRLDILSDMSKSERIMPTTVEFVDIAGLVRPPSACVPHSADYTWCAHPTCIRLHLMVCS